MWLRLSLLGAVAYSARCLTAYRRHDGTISATTRQDDERLYCDWRAVRDVLRREGHLLQEAPEVIRGARAAQAFRWLVRVEEHCRDGSRGRALRAALQAWRLLGSPTADQVWLDLLYAVLRKGEYEQFRATRMLLARAHQSFEGSRYGASVRKLIEPDPEWQRAMAAAAGAVRHATPPDCEVLLIDKHDPTLLHLAERAGRHFPELPGMAKGAYPRDSEQAIQHLEEARGHGSAYLVIPSHAFWWLDFYEGFASHLTTRYRRVWSDGAAVIFSLEEPSQHPYGGGLNSNAFS